MLNRQTYLILPYPTSLKSPRISYYTSAPDNRAWILFENLHGIVHPSLMLIHHMPRISLHRWNVCCLIIKIVISMFVRHTWLTRKIYGGTVPWFKTNRGIWPSMDYNEIKYNIVNVSKFWFSLFLRNREYGYAHRIQAATLSYRIDAGGQIGDVSEVFIHPDYDYYSLANDIALLRLSSPLNFTNEVQPVCLPSAGDDQPEAGSYVTFTGWGSYLYRGGKRLFEKKGQTCFDRKVNIWCKSDVIKL